MVEKLGKEVWKRNEGLACTGFELAVQELVSEVLHASADGTVPVSHVELCYNMIFKNRCHKIR